MRPVTTVFSTFTGKLSPSMARVPYGTGVSYQRRPAKMRSSLHGRFGPREIRTPVIWQSGWNEHAVPLSDFQTEVLRLLAANRDPESYVAGATPLNRNAARFSNDIDVFHDREERVAIAADQDAHTLQLSGYEVKWLRRLGGVYTAEVSKEGWRTRLEWVVDSDFRFFPTQRDELFGFILHPVDLAINKVMAAASRREVRDIVDLALIHETVLPLGPLVWAGVEKSPGFTPEGLIAEIRRNLHHPKAEWDSLASLEPMEPGKVVGRVSAALDDAEAFVGRMPTDKIGLVFLKGGIVVQPDPERLDEYEAHAGTRRGQWPTNQEIAEEMLDRYRGSAT